MVPHKLSYKLHYSLVDSPHLLTLLVISSNPRLQVPLGLQNKYASRKITEDTIHIHAGVMVKKMPVLKYIN